MKPYTIEQLSQPKTYTADPELATLARRAAEARYETVAQGRMGRGDFKRAVLAGEYPDLVAESVARAAAADLAEADLADRADLIALPGYSIRAVGARIRVVGPYAEEVASILKRMKGVWEPDENAWLLPLAAAKTLESRLRKALAEHEASETAEAAARVAAQARRDAERAERRAKAEAAHRAEEARMRRAIASRIKVPVGTHKIGDVLGGRAILSFGEAWTEAAPSPDWCKSGQRWDEECDRCGRVGVVDNNTSLCERCFGGGETKTVCYAYFE